MQFTRGTVALALVLLFAGAARSEMWTYSGSIDTGWRDPTGRFAIIYPGIIKWDPSNGISLVPDWLQSSAQGIVFSGIGGAGTGSRTVPGFLVGATFPKTWDVPSNNFNQFLPWFSTYALKFSIQDTASHKTGTLSFPGFLYGNQDSGGARFTAYYGTYPPLTNPDTGSLLPPKAVPMSQSITLGNNQYTLTVNPFTYSQVPLPTPADYAPTMAESVQVAVTPLGGSVAATPEPSAMLLAITGLAALAPLVRRRRGRMGR
jgi:MYXO-CTERM domain-containing protein